MYFTKMVGGRQVAFDSRPFGDFERRRLGCWPVGADDLVGTCCRLPGSLSAVLCLASVVGVPDRVARCPCRLGASS